MIEGASGLGPCHPYDTNCLENDLLGRKYLGNWSEATAEFVANSKAWGFVKAPAISYDESRHLLLRYAADSLGTVDLI